MSDEAGWIGDLSHCWHCGEDVDDISAMHWKSSQLLCESCGGGRSISAGLRRGMYGVLQHDHVRLSVGDAMQWCKMIGLVLREHAVKIPESFR